MPWLFIVVVIFDVLLVGFWIVCLFKLVSKLIALFKQRGKPKWPAELVAEIELAFIEEYRVRSDTTYGPSLVSTSADYFRLKMGVIENFAYQYPEVEFYYKEIWVKLDQVDLSK
ncbi:MAG: hypothetical protein HOP02_09455 [Methylococcaceae bacterium]|nr:hypothetical protein [Methylococcaceae bacterium]